MLNAAALQNTALNVVCNQEYAQVVPHVSRRFVLVFICSSLSFPARRSLSEGGPLRCHVCDR